MNLSDFDFDLPTELIAQTPLAERGASRLLMVDPQSQMVSDHGFSDLEDLLDPGDLLVLNDTRVIPARLFGQKESGGKLEVMVERLLDESRLLAHIRSSKSPRPGTKLILEGQIHCEMTARRDDLFELCLLDGSNWLTQLENHGHVPLPPYIKRDDEPLDRDRYQTVYAANAGAVAAPTAGLHFDQAILGRLQQKAVAQQFITLHVGAGTFQPVRNDDIEAHVMHAEVIRVTEPVCAAVAETRARGNRVVAVGTTVVRSLETAASSGSLQPFEGESRLFIKPGFEFNAVDAMLTNFHLPKSTLMMLVSAFAGTQMIRSAYQHAIEHHYRFFSYGDAMFINSRQRSRQ